MCKSLCKILFYYIISVPFFFPHFQWPKYKTTAWAQANDKVCIHTTGSQPGHYLQWKGRPLLLIGDSVTQGWMECGTNFNQRAYVDALASRAINLLMIWSYIATNATGQIADSRIGYDAPEIWPWNGGPDDREFDLTTFNQAYFDRLKDLVSYAESKGIVVLITVHDGWAKTRFSAHPFNSSLGNGPLADGSQYVELADYYNEMPETFNPSWSRQQKNQYFQERLCAKLISELNSYSNVIYEMFNEGEWYNQNLRNLHEQHFLAFFRARCTNLLLTNTDHIWGDYPHNDQKVDVITLHGGWTDRFDDFQSGFNNTPAKHYLQSETVPEWNGINQTLTTIRQNVWNVAVAGAGWVNQNDTSFGWDPNAAIVDQASVRNRAYDYAGYCAQFFNAVVNFSEMSPQGTLSSTGICLAKRGVEYVVYAPSGGPFTVDLSDTNELLTVKWYNPRTGETTAGGSVTGGGTRSFTAPDTNDWVLHIGDTAELVISNITVGSGENYEAVPNGLSGGAFVYIDRSYTSSSVPSSLYGVTYIKTAMGDKTSSGDAFLSFDVNQDVTVYVAHDNRITTKPSWLNSFTETGHDLVTTDTTLSLYAKDFSAGTITLGGNEGGGYSMYTVIVVGQGSNRLHQLISGLGETSGGWIEAFAEDYSHADWVRVGWTSYNSANGEARIATGDIDGDGKDEIVLGLAPVPGDFSIPNGWFQVLDDDRTHLAWGRINWSTYNSANGESWPACGDMDGDGRDEIIIGLGSGGGGYLEVFDYDAGTVTHKDWVRGGWQVYNSANGETRPACGDVDGDGRDEIVVGLGQGGGGYLEILDDATAGYAHLAWPRVLWGSYNSMDGETRPACGDVDGDGRDEIVVGLGQGGAGYLEVFDDATAGYAHLSWSRVHWAPYNSANGETRPACGDVDGDGRDEIVVGLGQGGAGYLEVFDDALSGYAHLAWPRVLWGSYNNANGETWPAVKR